MKKKLIQVLAQNGSVDKKTWENYVRGGQVTVAGKVVTSPAFFVDPKKKRIHHLGKPLLRVTDKVYLKFHKPTGVTCQREPGPHSIYALLRKLPGLDSRLKQTLFPVGRLDKVSTGLLFITNDGNFSQRVLDPASQLEKEYVVTISGAFTGKEKKRLAAGVRINAGSREQPRLFTTRPCRILQVRYQKTTTQFNIIITEGKKRQIRRMVEAVGCQVVTLHRQRIGTSVMGNLKPGAWASIHQQDIEKIFA